MPSESPFSDVSIPGAIPLTYVAAAATIDAAYIEHNSDPFGVREMALLGPAGDSNTSTSSTDSSASTSGSGFSNLLQRLRDDWTAIGISNEDI